MRMLPFISVFLLTCSLAAHAETVTFTGKVVSITDGDTIRVLHDEKPEIVRFNAVDCPEHDQPSGMQAKEFTSSLCLDKTVSVVSDRHDKYGRTIADVTTADGKSVNKELVRAGFAWWFRKYAPDNKELETLEAEAKAKHLGLWQDTNAIAPWDWRHGVREQLPALIK